jgi:indole-3-acetate monooxygenase
MDGESAPHLLQTMETQSMTYFACKAMAEDSPVLHAAIGLAKQIRGASDETETARRIPHSIAAAIKEAGVFGMAMPCAWGGPELDPLTQIRVIEALAMADGSAGWCAMIGCDGGYITAFLDQNVAREMYPDLLVATGAAPPTHSGGSAMGQSSAFADRWSIGRSAPKAAILWDRI